MKSDQGGPASPPDRQHQRGQHSAPAVTAEQARRELERRRGSPEQKAEGRAQAIAEGTFWLTGKQLAEIVAGWP